MMVRCRSLLAEHTCPSRWERKQAAVGVGDEKLSHSTAPCKVIGVAWPPGIYGVGLASHRREIETQHGEYV
jgi:hypothetical protein